MQVSIIPNGKMHREVDIAEADALLEKGDGSFSQEQVRSDTNHWYNRNRGAIFLFVRHYDPESLRTVKQSGDQRRGQTVDYGGQAVSLMAKIVELHKQFPLEIIGDIPFDEDQPMPLQLSQPPTIFECSRQVLRIINAAARGDDPIRNLQKILGQCYLVFSPFVAYGEARKISANIGQLTDDFTKKSRTLLLKIDQSARSTIGEFKKNADESKEFVDKVTKRISELESELEEKIENIKPEIERQARFFSDEAAGHKKQAGYWLAATILSLVALGCTGYWTLLNPIDFGDNISLIAQAIFGRAIIFGSLGSAIFMCARNYRSHRHNAVVNKHRENALKTYQAFLKEANDFKDPETKAIILDYAAKCIYAPQETGYDKIGGGKDATLIDIRRILGKTGGE